MVMLPMVVSSSTSLPASAEGAAMFVVVAVIGLDRGSGVGATGVVLGEWWSLPVLAGYILHRTPVLLQEEQKYTISTLKT